MRSVTRLYTLGTLGLGLAVAAPPAGAGGFASARFGGEHGHAATADVTATFYNPAGLAYGHGTRAYIEGAVFYRTVEYNRDAAAIDHLGAGTPADGVAANSGKATLANALLSPFIGIATDGGIEGLGIGLSLSAPFGGQASWDTVAADPKYPGALDSSARWASIEGAQRAVYYTLAAGWRTPDGQFGFGAGLNVVSSEVSLTRARNLDGTDDLVLDNGAVKEGRAFLDVKGLDLGASIGLVWKPTPCSRVGLSYQSQPGFGEQTLEGTLSTQLGSSAPGSIPIELRQSLPDVVRAGGEWRADDKVTLHAGIDYQVWSRYKAQCIVNPGAPEAACKTDDDGNLIDPQQSEVNANVVRGWHDAVAVRLGGSYQASDALELNGGVLYDSNAVPDKTLDPALMDMTKIIPQLGLRYLTGKVLLTATVGHVLYLDRTTEARTAAERAAAELSGKNRSPDMAGTYHQAVSYLIVGVGMSL